MRRRIDPNQILIDWSSPAPPREPADEPPRAAHPKKPMPAPPPLIQRLRWDFKTSFPPPTEEALEAGTISAEDTEPEALASLHAEHARHGLFLLHELDTVMDGRRLQVDPWSGEPPKTHAAKEKLRRIFEEEPGRLERSFATLIDVYENVFGHEAADAFTKAIRAWHAGVQVICDTSTPRAKRLSSVLPVPKPIRSAVRAGHFGRQENGRPVNPTAEEVRAITEHHAEKLIEVTGEAALNEGIAKYAEDFGSRAASQLQAYVLRKKQEIHR